MSRFKSFRLAVCAALCLLGFGSASATPFNLVANSSFESPPHAGVTVRYSTPGVPAGFSWTVGGAGVDLVETHWTAQDGLQSLDLNQDVGHPTSFLTPPGSVSQSLATVAGAPYLISFWMAANADNDFPSDTGPATKTMDVEFNSTVHSYSFDVTGHTLADPGWIQQQFIAIATGVNTNLSFVSTSSGYAGMIIDNVSVSVIPEPSTHAMLLAGLGLLGFAARRWTRKETA